jgi:hypothetical protein
LGNIGKRHVQSLLNLKFDLTILVVDNDQVQFEKFKRDFSREIKACENNIHIQFRDQLFTDLTIDVCIVATQNSVRHEIIEFLNTKNRISTWVLEKPISNSLESFEIIYSILQDCKSVYVNIPRETMKSYVDFKAAFRTSLMSCQRILITGNEWGLASNSIHFLRLAEWLSESRFLKIDFEGSNYLISTKRRNYFDLRARLVGIMENGCRVALIDDLNFNRFEIKFEFSSEDVFIYEEESVCLSESVKFDSFTLDLQSNLTSDYISDLLIYEACKLPLLKSISHLESKLLQALCDTNLYDKERKIINYT